MTDLLRTSSETSGHALLYPRCIEAIATQMKLLPWYAAQPRLEESAAAGGNSTEHLVLALLSFGVFGVEMWSTPK